MQTEILKVTGLNSDKCIDTVTRALTAVVGVSNVSVSLFRSLVTVEFDGKLTGTPQLESALANAGYTAYATTATGLDQGSCCGGCCS